MVGTTKAVAAYATSTRAGPSHWIGRIAGAETSEMPIKMLEIWAPRRHRGGMGLWRTAGLALGVRLLIIFLVPPGYPGDMAGWVDTTARIIHDGLAAAYAVLAPGDLYPPAFLYPLWLAGHVYTACCSTEFVHGNRA